MAKIIDTCAAIERWIWKRDPVDHGVDRMLPDQIDIIHAVLLGENPTGSRAEVLDAVEPVFLTHGKALEAACGTWVRALLTALFDSEHPKACPQCMKMIAVRG